MMTAQIERLDPNIDPAAKTGRWPVAPQRGIDRRDIALRDACRRGRRHRCGRSLIAAREGLVAQRELQRCVVGRESGRLERALQGGRVAPQEIERVGAVDDEMRRGAAAAVDAELHLDAAELRWVEANLELPL